MIDCFFNFIREPAHSQLTNLFDTYPNHEGAFFYTLMGIVHIGKAVDTLNRTLNCLVSMSFHVHVMIFLIEE
jgi:hypothetical protein